MTMLVDELRRYENGRWCHLVSDASLEELHAFARLLGLRRSGFQDKHIPHYDLRPSKRKEALALGALPVRSRELVKRAVRG